MDDKPIEKSLDKNIYSSPIAQIIESSGNFINNVSNTSFFMLILVLLGGGYLFSMYANRLDSRLYQIDKDLVDHIKNDIKIEDLMTEILQKTAINKN